MSRPTIPGPYLVQYTRPAALDGLHKTRTIAPPEAVSARDTSPVTAPANATTADTPATAEAPQSPAAAPVGSAIPGQPGQPSKPDVGS